MLNINLKIGERLDIGHPTGPITVTLEKIKSCRVEIRVMRTGALPKFREISPRDQVLVALNPRVVIMVRQIKRTGASFAYDARDDIPIRRSTAKKRCA